MATSSTSRRARLEEELGLLQQDVASFMLEAAAPALRPDEDAAQLSIKSGGEPSATERAIALLERAPPPAAARGLGGGAASRDCSAPSTR